MHPIISKLKNKVIELKANDTEDSVIRVTLKETLQNHIIHAIYGSDKFKELIFVGGTALRKLYNLNKMSEDLDFESEAKVNLKELGVFIENYFKGIDLDFVDFSTQTSDNLYRLTVKFKVLYTIGFADIPSGKLHVKIEITKTDGEEYPVELTPLNIEGLSTVVKHYDLPTMMSGKMLACLSRIWEKGDTGIKIKGRDYYDLIWYMEKKIVPNEKRLLAKSEKYTIKGAFKLLDKKVSKISSFDLHEDLRNYFIDKVFIKTWCENFHEFYKRFREYYDKL